MAYTEDVLEDIYTDEDWETEDILDLMEDEDWETEDWEPEEDDEESLTERRGRRWRKYRRRRPRRRRGRARYVRGSSGAQVRTPGGSARIRFKRPLAAQSDVNRSIKSINSQIGSVEKTVDKNTSVLDKKINEVRNELKKSQQSSQMMMILPLLMQKEPHPLNFTLKEEGADESTKKIYDVTDPKYKKEDNTFAMVLPFMMLPDRMGGSGSMLTTVMMVLLMSGGLK